ncbi:MAG: glycosyltransferase [Microthrixaceae bacterium]
MSWLATKIRLEWFLTDMAGREISKDTPSDALDALKVIRRDLTLRAAGVGVGPPASNLVLIIDLTFPDPTKDSGSDRIIRLAKMAHELGHPTVLASITHRKWCDITSADPDDLRVAPQADRWTDEQFWDWIRNASVIWLSRPDVAGRLLPVLADHVESRRVIFDTVDLYHVRLKRKAALTRNPRDRRAARAYKRLERSAVKAADMTLVVTDVERSIVQELVGSSTVQVIPNVHESRPKPVPPRSGRNGLVFYGSYRHAPNVDAVRHLYSTIMPAIWKKLPDIALTVIGDRLPEDLASSPDPRIHVVGWVEDLHPIVDSSVALIAPLRFGAGLKGKIGFAMANGLPVITTSVGVEGMEAIDGTTCLIGSDDEDLVRKCVDLLGDDDLWSTLSRAGITSVESTLSASAVRPLLGVALDGPG